MSGRSIQQKNMEMGRNALLAYIILCYSLAVDGGDNLSLGASLTGNKTLISKNGTFELGFFSPTGTNNWYIGIWYAQISEKTIVWVANRKSPIKNLPGDLKLSRDGHLRLFDGERATVWSVNETKKASGAVLLDSGNFLMVGNENKSDIVWQSFDHPVDTWLPGIKLGGQKKLVAWKNSLDPAPGPFSLQMDPSGAKQFVLLWNNSEQYWESGVWDGKIFAHMPEMSVYSQTPEMARSSLPTISLENTSSGLYLTYTFTPTVGVLSRFVLHKTGAIRVSLFQRNEWNMFWSQPRDQCSVYHLCGTFGMCNSNNLQFCSCVEGFNHRDNRSWDLQEWWSSGCVPQTPFNCDPIKGSSDGFMALNASLPDYQVSSYPAQTQKDCEKICLRNCYCTAFSFNPSSGPCQIWSRNLLNMQTSGNSKVFVRVPASALDLHGSSSSKRKTAVIVGAVVGAVAAFAIVVGIFQFLLCRRRRLITHQKYGASSNSSLTMFTYKELKTATKNFTDKLRSGGFGSVFKGALTDGTLVAIKNLEGSRQGEKQFRAEISSVGNIQHVNLVRLRGICAEGSRRSLVYDYMPNGSLNLYLFSPKFKSEGKVLDWKTRFEIALGTAKGLVYLHDKCRERIIHGDVKPENILLDDKFSPMLGDFGLAKLVGRNFSRVLTTTRGTRGYLAPEWISGLPITSKVDVYSFGVTLLEIISGRRNLDLSVQESSKCYFPTWAASQIRKGNMMNIVEESVAEKADVEEVRRACEVSVLCIEEDENARPSMEQVVLMLEGKMKPSLTNYHTDTTVLDVQQIFSYCTANECL